MDIEKLRNQIPVTQNMVYMNTDWPGPSPTPVIEAIIKRLKVESGRETRQNLREALTTFFHVSPMDLTLTQKYHSEPEHRYKRPQLEQGDDGHHLQP